MDNWQAIKISLFIKLEISIAARFCAHKMKVVIKKSAKKVKILVVEMKNLSKKMKFCSSK